MSESPCPYHGDSGDETEPLLPYDPRPVDVVSACRRIQRELEQDLTYARLYERLSRKDGNHEAEQQWADQVHKLLMMLAELAKEELDARRGSIRLQEHAS